MSVTRSARLLALAAVMAAPSAFAADATAGKAVFDKYACGTCHSTTTEPGGPPTGPTLAGVVGRKAASVASFPTYTEALKKHGVTWDEKTLDEFLANPMAEVPGTMVVMPVPDAKERADVIEYVKTLRAR